MLNLKKTKGVKYMGKVEKKKILRSGKSGAVVIPRWWLKLNSLDVGGYVLLEIEPKKITIKKGE